MFGDYNCDYKHLLHITIFHLFTNLGTTTSYDVQVFELIIVHRVAYSNPQSASVDTVVLKCRAEVI